MPEFEWDFTLLLISSGLMIGLMYALIALGFVLVYKATEVVNFAQGDLMMLGGFFAFTFIGMLGLNYWVGFAGAVIAMALFGMLAERVVVRPILGYPQFSIIMATIGLGYFLRSIVGMIWGTDDFKIETPFSQGVLRIGALVLGLKAFPAAVLGGFGSIPGAVVGGVLIGVIESMAGFYLAQGWKDVAPYIVLLAVLLLKPEGLFGLHVRKKV